MISLRWRYVQLAWTRWQPGGGRASAAWPAKLHCHYTGLPLTDDAGFGHVAW